WAAHHGLEKVPSVLCSFDSEDEAREQCEKLNTERRHLESTNLALLRAERIRRIAERRQRGESQRAIAEAENISRAQVVEDLKAAGGQGGCPPEPEPTTVIGRDGKTYAAKQGICERCQRIGTPLRDCQRCAALQARIQAKKRTKTKPRKQAAD